MKTHDIPRILFEEFKEGEEVIVEKQGVNYHLAPLKCKGAGVIGWFSRRCPEGERSHLLVFVEPVPPSEKTLDGNELIRISCGPLQPLNSSSPARDTIYLHPISNRWWLEYPLALPVTKILARAVELFHSPECEKKKL
jgi:hypothetical protein